MRKFLLLASVLASPAFAGDAEDAVDALLTQCIDPLERSGALASGLERAAPEMEAKLLDGKDARILRTANSKVVVVAHNSGATCEIMALGMTVSDFDTALRAWLSGQDAYQIDKTANLGDDAPGGAYIARQIEGGFVQAFIQSQPEQGFIGITASRTVASAQARELLGLEPPSNP